MNLRTELANSKNYGGSRDTSTIRYLVVHYTANDGDSDQNNGLYFKNNYVGASAHYFVDSDSVTQSVPDNYVAWHCGANSYRHSTCRNSNSIGIELCDDRKNGVIYPTNETIANALELVEYLMNKYSIPKENVIRHYDVTGKLCPEYWSGNTKNDGLWKTEFWNKIGNNKVNTPTVTPTVTPTATSKKMYRIFNSSGKQLGAYSIIENVLNDAKTRLLNGEDVKLTVRNK